MHKVSLYLVLTLFLMMVSPSLIYGQSKPQMVRPVCPTNHNTRGYRPQSKQSEFHQYKNRQSGVRKHKQSAVQKNKRPQRATYLSVNKKFRVDDVYDYKRQCCTYKVDTDGQEWRAYNLSTWCYIVHDKPNNSFRLYCLENYTHDNRQCTIKVVSDDRSVLIGITQTGKPLNIVAQVKSAYMKMGKSQSIITSVVNIQGAGGVPCLVCADILDVYENPIKASYGYSEFGDDKGDIHMVESISPLKDDKCNYTIIFRIPNRALRIDKKGKMPLQCHLYVYCERMSSKVSQETDYKLNFVAKKKKNRVVIKRK